MTERHPAVPLQPVIDPAGWRADDVDLSAAFALDDGHLAELDAALARLEKTGVPIETMRSSPPRSAGCRHKRPTMSQRSAW